MKETLFTRHHHTVEPIMIAMDRQVTLQTIRTSAIKRAVNSKEVNVVLDDCSPLINNSEKDINRKERTTIAQQRSGQCRLLG